MKVISLLLLFLFVFNFSDTQAQDCNCPNDLGFSSPGKADTVFRLSNGKSIALCGYKDTQVAEGRTYYSEFVLTVCGEKSAIKFWGATLECQLRVHSDTLLVETIDSLPTGKNMQYKWTVWTVERIFFRNGKATKDFRVNRQIPKYNEQQIQAVLNEYRKAIKKTVKPTTVNNINMEIADRLFMSAISGSKQARAYLKDFDKHFGGLDGEYAEWYDDLIVKLKVWDSAVVSK